MSEPSFWDTLKSVGIETATKVTTPVFSGISKAFSNVVTGTQNKVAEVVSNVVNTTKDPFKKASLPAQPPTSAPVPEAAVLQTPGARNGWGNFGVLIAAGLIVLLIYLMRRRT